MLYDFQKPVYQRLLAAAIAFDLSRSIDAPIKGRYHRLIIGPTGSGKTWLANAVAARMGWPTLIIDVSSWIILGARETPTWKILTKWASGFSGPFIVILDEIGQIWGQDSWTRYLRTELYSLLDGRVPPQLSSSRDVFGRFGDDCLVFGIGAFQQAFDAPFTIGFRPEATTPKGLSDLSRYSDRELLNRFVEVLILPSLSEADYRSMIKTAADKLPEDLVPPFLDVAERSLPAALRDRTGARFVETVLASLFVEAAEAFGG